MRKSWRLRTGIAASLLLAGSLLRGRADDSFPVLSNHWFEARSPHFRTFSYGVTQQVAKLAARLEQFRVAYEGLAGTQSVTSPPIEVLALPDHDSLKQFLPLYGGQPANLSGFFHRGSDENLIVVSLAEGSGGSLETIFHEYAHLLLRRNQQFWPMWLNEGMADIYGTFEVTGDHSARIGKPRELYLHLLATTPMLPLKELFAVGHDSPEYNERDRQGIFYAESWLLTHYLMIGSPAHRKNFGRLTTLLRQGQSPEEAFTNAFATSSSTMQKELERYAHESRLGSLDLAVRPSLLTTQPLVMRSVSPAEISFRLGDELLRIGRDSEAEAYFRETATLAPASSLSYEGLGLLEAEHGHPPEAVENLKKAIQLGSKSFLAHYTYAREKLLLNASAGDKYSRLPEPEAAELRKELESALALMPEFGPAHHLLGFLELIQGENLASAAEHLKRAIALEPERTAYLLTLAQVQMAEHQPAQARASLEIVYQQHADEKLRARAEEMLKEIPPRANLASPR